MTLQRMEHVGFVVADLAAATKFFVELGLELQGEGPVAGRWVDRVAGLDGVRAETAMLQTPDGHGRLELSGLIRPLARCYTDGTFPHFPPDSKAKSQFWKVLAHLQDVSVGGFCAKAEITQWRE